MPYELTVVVPTYNERENIASLVDSLESALGDIDWQLVIVDDDSPDGTAMRVKKLMHTNDRLRCIHRIGRRGLSSACIEGFESAEAPFVAVMDADLQHDERLLPQMLKLLEEEGIDLVIGSRHIAGGSVGDGLNHYRRWVSRTATWMSRLVVKGHVTDPMSGFFMFRRDRILPVIPKLSGKGYKILLDLMASSPKPLKFQELPYVMRARQQGESKLDSRVILDYVALLIEKMARGLIPARFVLFATVGASGLLVHVGILGLFHRLLEMNFTLSQILATWVAMTSNYVLNNLITFKDKMLHGSAFWWGLLSFYAACFLGALVNVAVAEWLFRMDSPWWLAGPIGALVGAIWNFALTSHMTWGGRRALKARPESDK